MRVLYGDDTFTAAAAERAALQNQKNRAIIKAKIESGEFSTAIRPQVQARHIEGTPEFERYKAQRTARGQTPQSILSVTAEEAQALVDKYARTGTVEIHKQKNGTMKIIEYADADSVVGRFYANDAYHDTKRIGIFCSKKGTHVVPTNPEGKKK